MQVDGNHIHNNLWKYLASPWQELDNIENITAVISPLSNVKYQVCYIKNGLLYSLVIIFYPNSVISWRQYTLNCRWKLAAIITFRNYGGNYNSCIMQVLTFSTSCQAWMSCNTSRSSPIYIHSRSHTGGGSAVNLSDFCQRRDSERERCIKWKFKPRAYSHRDRNPDKISLYHPSQST